MKFKVIIHLIKGIVHDFELTLSLQREIYFVDFKYFLKRNKIFAQKTIEFMTSHSDILGKILILIP